MKKNSKIDINERTNIVMPAADRHEEETRTRGENNLQGQECSGGVCTVTWRPCKPKAQDLI